VPRSLKTINRRPNEEAQRAALVRGRHNDLSTQLEHLASELGVLDPKKWAGKQHRRINRAVYRRRHDKLTEWHIKNVPPALIAESDPPIPMAIIQAVFLESKLSILRGCTTGRDDDLVKRATEITFDDLRPHEKRAAALINGAKRKAKRKHPIEEGAKKLAASLEAFSVNQPVGRPKGSSPKNIMPVSVANDGDQAVWSYYSVPLSITDMCEVVVPIIEEITGSRITSARGAKRTPGKNLAFKTLMAAININIPGAEHSSVRRAIHHLKRDS